MLMRFGMVDPQTTQCKTTELTARRAKERSAGSRFLLWARGGSFFSFGGDSPRPGNAASPSGPLTAPPMVPPRKVFGKLFPAEAIEHALFRYAALTRHLDAPMRQIDLAG